MVSEMGEACSTARRYGDAYKALTGKRVGKIPLRRPTLTLEDNIKIEIKVIACLSTRLM
jgi:hypothetical protein